MKYKLGDKVRIRKDLNKEDSYGIPCNSSMLKLKGRLATIVDFYTDAYDKGYKIDLDRQFYVWSDKMFEGLSEYTYEDLKNAPVGTKVMFETGEILVKKDEIREGGNVNIWENGIYFRSDRDLLGFEAGGNLGKIINIEEPTYTTVYEAKIYEAKVEILNKKEKEYLSNVIKPFKDRIISIKRKTLSEKSYSYLILEYKEIYDIYNVIGRFSLPVFKTNTMYEGMQENIEYTLEELKI